MAFDPGFAVKDFSEVRHGELVRGSYAGPASFIFFETDGELLAVVFDSAGPSGYLGPMIVDPPRRGVCQTFGTDWRFELDTTTVSFQVSRYYRSLGSVLTSPAGSALIAGPSPQMRHEGVFQLDLDTLSLVDEPHSDQCIAHGGWSIWRGRDRPHEGQSQPLLSWPMAR